ncbi:MAG: rRNA pseudouridine synthase [candidate division NC10 bacterium]|nr:rRNA pseudouridine synthase [candidate division NC10 bacterium]
MKPVQEPKKERLQKILARAGLGSRRRCEQLILEGRVVINGQVVANLGAQAVPGRDRIQVDGCPLSPFPENVYILLYKPRGYITSRSDPQGRPVVLDLLPRHGLPPLFPVGRLDFETEGLILLTNDGELAQALLHPRFKIPKVYHAKVKGHPGPEALKKLKEGIVLDGEALTLLRLRPLRKGCQNVWLEMELTQGRYRQIRRMCEAVGHPVLKLKRVGFGPLRLGNLKRGDWRRLNGKEVLLLRSLGKSRA